MENIKKLKHINLVLRSIRTVNRLLVTENDPELLISKICTTLVENREYNNAWIILHDSSGKVSMVAESGVGEAFHSMMEGVKNGQRIRCVDNALKSSDFFVVHDPAGECHGCFHPARFSGYGTMAVRLEHDGRVYGVMVLSVPKELDCDLDERRLVKEIAGDIAFGLYRIELEKKRKTAENALRESEQRFRTLTENFPNCIQIILGDQVVYRNSGQRRLHGFLSDAFLPPDFETVHPDDKKQVLKFYGKISSGIVHQLDIEYRFYPCQKPGYEGDLRWVFCRGAIVDYSGEQAILISLTDTTGSRELEHFLRIQDKMTSLGRVTAGIAHEIRNPLSGINIYLNMLQKAAITEGWSEKSSGIVEKIQTASGKIEEIIKRVMDFSKPGTPKFILTNLNPYVDEVTKLTAVSLRKSGIMFEQELDACLPDCWTDPHLIEEVVLNLITNAAEALKHCDGTKVIQVVTISCDGSICIRVADSGPGISENRRDRIFDPFYTTKTNSSGIGLSICHRIITDHGGAIKYRKSRWGGAEFEIKIPAKKEEQGA